MKVLEVFHPKGVAEVWLTKFEGWVTNRPAYRKKTGQTYSVRIFKNYHCKNFEAAFECAKRPIKL